MMKKTWCFLLSLMGMVVVLSCRPDVNDRLMDRAKACVETCADSSLWYLQQVEPVLTDGQQARYALLWTQAQHKCRIPLVSDSLINVAVRYYTENNNRHQLALSLLYKGLVHKQNHQVEQAVEAFVASELAFEGVEDDQYKALLYNHYAALLMNQEMFDEALEYHKKSYLYEIKGDSVHYIISTCGQIAKLFKIMGQLDSAKAYYERGLSYADNTEMKNNIRYYLLLQNYANFLRKNGEYEKAEQMLLECELLLTGKQRYSVYSSLATLYYDTKDYAKALTYAEKMKESTDSLMMRGYYLHLYRIHTQLGNKDKAHECYKQYTDIHDAIQERLKTKEVAEIPHKMKALRLEEENRTAYRWQWVWGIGAVVVFGGAVWTVKYLRQRHGKQMKVKETLLVEQMERLVEKTLQLEEERRTLSKIHADMGGLKGVVTKQKRTIEELQHEQREMKTQHGHVVKELKNEIKELQDEQTEARKLVKREMDERDGELKLMHEKEKQLQQEMCALVAEVDNSQLLHRFLLDVGNVRPVLLILELKSGRQNSRYPIHRTEYAELLKQLAEYAHPGIRETIETDEVLKGKQEMACLIALGYDDMEMLRMVTNLKPNSVRAYSTQVRTALRDILQN